MLGCAERMYAASHLPRSAADGSDSLRGTRVSELIVGAVLALYSPRRGDSEINQGTSVGTVFVCVFLCYELHSYSHVDLPNDTSRVASCFCFSWCDCQRSRRVLGSIELGNEPPALAKRQGQVTQISQQRALCRIKCTECDLKCVALVLKKLGVVLKAARSEDCDESQIFRINGTSRVASCFGWCDSHTNRVAS